MRSASRVSRRGISAIWLIVMIVGLSALASLAVDYGRYEVVKSELRRAADAAARAAASNIGNPAAARTLATNYAGSNAVDGVMVAIDAANDVRFGRWDPVHRQFTELTAAQESTGDAVKVTTSRDVPLMWGSLVATLSGKSNSSVKAVEHSIVAVAPDSFGVIGLNSISMTGNTTDSYWAGGTGTTGGNDGSIASNGTINLSGGATIHGNARGTITGTGSVTGTTGPLPGTLSFPNGDGSAYVTVNDNGQIPSKFLSGTAPNQNLTLGKNQPLPLAGGSYYLNNISLSTGSTLTFNGPTTIYCHGTFTMNGQTVTSSSLPKNLTLVMCPGPTGTPPGVLTITSGAALYANIYAPQSNVNISGQGAIYGSVLGLTVNMTGGGAIHYDLSLKGTGAIVLVE
jgi:Flp pilus assembly protein TadG